MTKQRSSRWRTRFLRSFFLGSERIRQKTHAPFFRGRCLGSSKSAARQGAQMRSMCREYHAFVPDDEVTRTKLLQDPPTNQTWEPAFLGGGFTGKTIGGRFRVEAMLGRGSVGVVYRAK